MCVRFNAAVIFYVPDEIRISENAHSGAGKKIFEKNTIWCIDKKGNWYVFYSYTDAPYVLDDIVTADPKNWPLNLHRDYWRHYDVKNAIGAPLYDAIRDAPRKIIKGKFPE